jgi:diacylglycerol kinase family enzyme
VPRRVAVVLNRSAPGVTRKLVRALRDHGGAAVHETASLDDARTAIRGVVARGVDAVVFGGGDGTIVMGLALLAEACRGYRRREPAIGVLRLGSGNALADALGAEPGTIGGAIAQVERALDVRHAPRSWPLLDVLGVRAPFAGIGLDAQLLADRAALGAVIDRLPLARAVIGTRARYAASVALLSVPRFALRARPHVVVRNLGAPAEAMGADRAPTGRTIEPGEVLWEGACTMVAGATIPCFGFGLQMFPFARARRDRFHLRAADPGMTEIVRSTPAAFRGEYFSPQVHDFLVEKVALELEVEVAVEAGGELLGRHARVELGLAPPIGVL